MLARKIFFNTVFQSFAKVISVAIGLLTIALMTRFLGNEGFGQYTTIISFMGFFGILADLGLYLVTTQEISKEGADERKILSNVFALRFTTVILTLLAGAAIALLFPYPGQVKLGMFIGIATFTFVSGTQVLIGVFQKHLIFYKLSLSEILQRIVFFALVFLSVSKGLSLLYFVLALTISNGIHFFVSLHIARNITPFGLGFDLAFWKAILKKSWPLAFSVVLNLIYFRADTLILSVFKPASDVGIYGVSYKILEVLMAFPAMFAGLIMPILSRTAFSDPKQYRSYLQNSFNALLLVIVPMIITTLFFAGPIINIIGGSEFPRADNVLRILIFATALIYLGNLLGYTVVALNAQKKMLFGYLAGAVCGLILYLLLIPKYSYYGAAIATVAVETVVLFFSYTVTSRASNYYPSFSILGKAVLASLPMIAVFYFLKINWVAEFVLGLGVYLAGAYALKTVPKEFIVAVLKKPDQGDSRLSP